MKENPLLDILMRNFKYKILESTKIYQFTSEEINIKLITDINLNGNRQ